ncbi:MAG TPA: putative quinol monooxygenase [Acetobacteraceae bacterium]|nr:putative quinol monooxygenase [Acetobacteraceae bacterium]
MGGPVDGYVILARFRIAPGRRHEFLEHIGRNAAASVADEPGCRRFDVLTSEAETDGQETGGRGAGGDEDDEVVLYEIYDSPAAFAAHLGTPHFAAFRAATKAMVLSSAIERFYLRENARG